MLPFKRLFFILTVNIFLLMMLIIGIQNSYQKAKIKFIRNETVELPISFILGLSFICGSTLGGLLPQSFLLKKK